MSRLAADEITVPVSGSLVSSAGTVPRLTTADEFTSYVEVYNVAGPGAQFAYPAIQLLPNVVSLPTLTIDVQVTSRSEFNYHAVYLVDISEGGVFGDPLLLSEESSFVEGVFPADVWVRHTYSLVAGVDYDQSRVEAVVAAGNFVVLADIGGLVTSQTQVLSMLTVSVGETYLRLFARDDGLGTNAPRIFGATSQQSSLRIFGNR